MPRKCGRVLSTLRICLAILTTLALVALAQTAQDKSTNTTTNTHTHTDTNTRTGAATSAAKVLLTFDVTQGWKDASKAGGKISWKDMPAEAPRAAGVRIDFPAVKPGEWINFTVPVKEGAWPLRGQKIAFWSRSETPGKALVRLNEMPGAAEGHHTRHGEFEGHAAAFDVGAQWRQVQISLAEFRVLWRHAASNGQLDLHNITGIGFEPADAKKPLTLDIAGLQVLDGDPPPQFSGFLAQYRVLFNSDRDGDYEILAMDADSRNLDRLTRNSAYDLWPAPSPDGKRIAWMTNRDGDYEIYVMHADGSEPVNVSKHPKSQEGHPIWSPDGKWLCYHALLHDHFSICVVELATGRVEQLTRGRGANRNPRFARRVEEAAAPPSIPPDGVRILAAVNGYLTSGQAGPNPQKYPFQYKGHGVLDKTQVEALKKGGPVAPALAQKIGQALLWPGVGDELTAIKLQVADQKLVGEAKVLHRYGKQGTHVIEVKLEGTFAKDQFTLRAVEPKIGGTWDWGGGIAKQEGRVDIKIEVQTSGGAPHATPDKVPAVKTPAEKKTVGPTTKGPAKAGAVKITAKIDGYTQATMFNPQKYPFKYAGAAKLDADHIQALAKSGDIPDAVARSLMACALWPGQDDKLEKIKLKSDGKKLTGEVQILHNYGKQGTHTLKFRLHGAIENGRLSLRAVEPTVTGTWRYDGGSIQLKGEVKIQFEVGP